MAYSLLFHFTKSCEIHDFESTFFKSFVFVKVIKSSYPVILFARGRLVSMEMLFWKQQFTAKRRIVISNNVFWQQVREGSLPCLTVHLHSLDSSCADLRKSDMMLPFSHLEIGTIPEKPYGNSTQWIDCFLGSFSSLLAPEHFWLVQLPHQPSFTLALPVAA